MNLDIILFGLLKIARAIKICVSVRDQFTSSYWIFFYMYVWTFFYVSCLTFLPFVYDKLRPFSLADRINIKLPKELGSFFSCIWCAILCVHSYMNVLPRNEFLLVLSLRLLLLLLLSLLFLFSERKKSMMLLLYYVYILNMLSFFYTSLFLVFLFCLFGVVVLLKKWKKLIEKK